MHNQWLSFSYPLERPYPFRWFTWVALFGGLIAAVFLSFVSVATQGYETVAVYTSDPNVTEANQGLFAKWPDFLKVKTLPVCSPTSMPVNTHFFTNNTALTYTLRSITYNGDGERPPALAASLPYKNNLLQRCRIEAIELELESVQRNALQIARQEWGGVAKAYVNCSIDTATGPATLSLMTSYEHTSTDRSSSFASPDETTKASLSMGEALLSWYSLALSLAMKQSNDQFRSDQDRVVKGYLELFRRDGIYDIKSLDYFRLSCFFETLNGQSGLVDGVYHCPGGRLHDLINAPVGDPEKPLPGIWISVDSLAKVFYHTVLTDLGQVEDQDPNPLVDPSLVEYFTRNITAIVKEKEAAENLFGLGRAGIGSAPVTAQEAGRLPLGVRPSVITASYLCQVPRLKSKLALVVAVLINDAVLLSALWGLYVRVVARFVLTPEMMVCNGCPCDKGDFS